MDEKKVRLNDANVDAIVKDTRDCSKYTKGVFVLITHPPETFLQIFKIGIGRICKH